MDIHRDTITQKASNTVFWRVMLYRERGICPHLPYFQTSLMIAFWFSGEFVLSLQFIFQFLRPVLIKNRFESLKNFADIIFELVHKIPQRQDCFIQCHWGFEDMLELATNTFLRLYPVGAIFHRLWKIEIDSLKSRLLTTFNHTA